MAYTHARRLTALDASFLGLETPSVHMHVGSVGIFDPGPLAREDGGLRFERVCELAEAGLRREPRFRQKLAQVPISGHPVWVDDAHFNLLYHLRHTDLPLPGDARQLKRLVGRIMSQKLDRSKPMWELWFVEGLEDGRFAVISKVHHCLVDGISGVDLLSAFMGPDPDYSPEPSDHRWIPRPAPTPLGLLGSELSRRAGLPLRLLRQASAAAREPRRNAESAAHAAAGFAKSLSGMLTPASQTPFNVPIGPHRRFDWTRFDLGVVREVKERIGGTLNDVVLACVAGAVRSHLAANRTPLDGIDFRVFVPVSTRTAEQRGKLGNRVSLLIAPLPVGEADPARRAQRVVQETRRLKASGQSQGAQAFEELSDLTSSVLLTGMSRWAASRRAYNLVVTNVPGPSVPIYLSGARMLMSYPLVPLFENQALGIALFSYEGGLHWGFNSDRDALPDLHDFVGAVEQEFETLRKL
jgi:WS/DGAT/MGAT family acyltransferase